MSCSYQNSVIIPSSGTTHRCSLPVTAVFVYYHLSTDQESQYSYFCFIRLCPSWTASLFTSHYSSVHVYKWNHRTRRKVPTDQWRDLVASVSCHSALLVIMGRWLMLPESLAVTIVYVWRCSDEELVISGVSAAVADAMVTAHGPVAVVGWFPVRELIM